MYSHWAGRGAMFVVFFVLRAVVIGALVMVLWNALIPDVFHGPWLSYWQSVGLLALVQLMVHPGGGGSVRWRRHGRDHWRHRFEAKLASMSPEDQEKFRAEWRRRCGSLPDEPASATDR